jgi:hypothetical protein
MTPLDMVMTFKRMNVEGRVVRDWDLACACFAGWLAQRWDDLDETEIALLTSVGAQIWWAALEDRRNDDDDEPVA